MVPLLVRLTWDPMGQGRVSQPRAGQQRALLLPSQTMQRVGGGRAERSGAQGGLLGPRRVGRGPWAALEPQWSECLCMGFPLLRTDPQNSAA